MCKYPLAGDSLKIKHTYYAFKSNNLQGLCNFGTVTDDKR